MAKGQVLILQQDELLTQKVQTSNNYAYDTLRDFRVFFFLFSILMSTPHMLWKKVVYQTLTILCRIYQNYRCHSTFDEMFNYNTTDGQILRNTATYFHSRNVMVNKRPWSTMQESGNIIPVLLIPWGRLHVDHPVPKHFNMLTVTTLVKILRKFKPIQF